MSLMNKVVNIKDKQKIPPPHDIREAQKIINKLAENGDNVSYSFHAREQMVRGFTYNDMLTILRDGVVREAPRYNEKKRSWAYRVDFIKFEDNRDAGCVVTIQKKGKLHVITIMWIDL
jgi:hypothetical protein